MNKDVTYTVRSIPMQEQRPDPFSDLTTYYVESAILLAGVLVVTMVTAIGIRDFVKGLTYRRGYNYKNFRKY